MSNDKELNEEIKVLEDECYTDLENHQRKYKKRNLLDVIKKIRDGPNLITGVKESVHNINVDLSGMNLTAKKNKCAFWMVVCMGLFAVICFVGLFVIFLLYASDHGWWTSRLPATNVTISI